MNLTMTLIEGIAGVNDDSPMRQGQPNAHYGKSPEETSKRYGEFVGRCDFICAYLGRRNDRLFETGLHWGHRVDIEPGGKASQQDSRPANALIAKAVELCEARSVPSDIRDVQLRKHSSLRSGNSRCEADSRRF